MSMWTRHSLLVPLIGLLSLTALFTMAAGYLSNHTFLWRSLHDKTLGEVETTAEHIAEHIAHEADEMTSLISTFFAQYYEMTIALEKLEHSDSSIFTSEVRRLNQLFPDLGLGYMIIVDRKGRIVHANGSGFSVGEVFDDWGIVDALAGEKLIAVGRKGRMKWTIHVFSPLVSGATVFGVIVSGIMIDESWFEEVHQQMVLADLDGVLGGSFDTENWLPIDLEQIKRTLLEKKHFTILDHEREQGWHFSPIRIVDETFCLILPIDLKPVHETLAQSRDSMIRYLVVVIVVIGFLGMGLYHWHLRPLRRLGDKAAIMAEVCRQNGDDEATSTVVLPIRNELHRVEGAFETVSLELYAHIGDLRHGKSTAEASARRDSLTGLGNRLMFDELLEKVLAQCRRGKSKLAVLYLDLDRFKPINDTYGHDVGDLLLKEVSARMQKSLRDSDAICRRGGDEFAAFLTDCHGADFAIAVSNRILDDVSRPYHLNGHDCSIGISIGISLFPDHADTAETLMKKADEALYQAKDAGRGVCRLFDEHGGDHSS